MPAIEDCCIEWCDRSIHTGGYCGAHYMRKSRGADMNAPHRKKRSGKCRAESCGRPDVTGGYCAVHYWRKRNGHDMNAPIRSKRETGRPCSVDDCDREARKRGYCETHYQRSRCGRDMSSPLQERVEQKCSVDDCGRSHSGLGYCDAHYQRKRRGLDMNTPVRVTLSDRQCSALGCQSPNFARGYCETHRARFLRTGDTAPVFLAKQIDWSAAHIRCRALWGAASQYPCIDCGKAAAHWAYDGTDPQQSYGQHNGRGTWMFYSRFPEFYMPMCARCHRHRDAKVVRRELEEYRTLKHELGLTYEQIAAAAAGLTLQPALAG